MDDLNSIKILVVDDDESIRILLRTAMNQWGYQTVEASNGEEAWEIMQQPDAPQILILDWLMPKMDGLALCQRIRQQSASYPYIIFLTQVSGAKNILKGFDAGADEFLLKPINFAELRSRVFAGEKIVKYLTIIEEQKEQVKQLVYYTKTLEQLIKMAWNNS